MDLRQSFQYTRRPQTDIRRHAPLVVSDREVFDHALRGHLFDDLLWRAILVDDAQSRPLDDRLARRLQSAHEGHVKHAQRARRELMDHMCALACLVHRIELDRGELMPIA